MKTDFSERKDRVRPQSWLQVGGKIADKLTTRVDWKVWDQAWLRIQGKVLSQTGSQVWWQVREMINAN